MIVAFEAYNLCNFQYSQDTPLNETRMEGVQSESTPSSSSKEEFVVSNDNPVRNTIRF
jgi:hypothetical protein